MEPWIDEAANECWQHRDEPEQWPGIIAKWHQPFALSARCAAERVLALEEAVGIVLAAFNPPDVFGDCPACGTWLAEPHHAADCEIAAALAKCEAASVRTAPTTPPLDSSSAAR